MNVPRFLASAVHSVETEWEGRCGGDGGVEAEGGGWGRVMRRWIGPQWMWRVEQKSLLLSVLLLMASAVSLVCGQSSETDTVCLQGLRSSFEDSTGVLQKNWTGANFPCNDTYEFVGITCSSLRVLNLNLSSFGLKGSISSTVESCTHLNFLDLADNSLSGDIPVQLSDLSFLVRLDLSRNQLTGTIPDLGNCTDLNVIDLHDNSLSGEIPASLGLLAKLAVFDVSNNDLEGPIPTTLSNTSSGAPRFNVSSFTGNKDLYGYPLPNPSSHGLSVLAIVGIGLGSGMLSLIVSFTAVCIWLRVTEQRLAAEEGKISQLMPDS